MVTSSSSIELITVVREGASIIGLFAMMSYYSCQREILLDGHDLRAYTLQSPCNQVALVSQNVHLFNDTMANNIAYARMDEYSRE